MPAYNAHETIRESVESALAQTVEDIEVIVVDDGSDPPIREALLDVRDPRLRVLRHPRNRNSPAARNTALAAVRSPFVSQLDADDLWEPDYLESVLPCFDDPAVGLTYTNARVIGGPVEVTISEPSVHPMDRFPKIAEQNPMASVTVTMRTDAVRDVGGYAEWLWVCDDYHLYLKLAHAGWRFAYVDKPLAIYRWPQPGRGQSYREGPRERNVLLMYLTFMLRHPLTPGPRRQVRTRLKQELRRLRS
jgi:cellulose synthase/poly-beta-1,6-N-acetylglucosamine synthase-like glycosyltransferase